MVTAVVRAAAWVAWAAWTSKSASQRSHTKNPASAGFFFANIATITVQELHEIDRKEVPSIVLTHVKMGCPRSGTPPVGMAVYVQSASVTPGKHFSPSVTTAARRQMALGPRGQHFFAKPRSLLRRSKLRNYREVMR